jgi:flagellar basal-body rod modification protein FlgD
MDAIGSVLSSGKQAVNASSLNQEDFIKLFLTQLNFQDPMEPVDNREFLAQIAQFSALEQARTTGDSINDIVTLNSVSQSVSLLSKYVEVSTLDGVQTGTVSAVRFTNDGPILTITATGGGILTDIKLSQIGLVRTI